MFLFEIEQISSPLWSTHFYTMNLKTNKNFKEIYSQLKEFTNYKTNSLISTFNNTTSNCNQEFQFTELASNSSCKNNKHHRHVT